MLDEIPVLWLAPVALSLVSVLILFGRPPGKFLGFEMGAETSKRQATIVIVVMAITVLLSHLLGTEGWAVPATVVAQVLLALGIAGSLTSPFLEIKQSETGLRQAAGGLGLVLFTAAMVVPALLELRNPTRGLAAHWTFDFGEGSDAGLTLRDGAVLADDHPAPFAGSGSYLDLRSGFAETSLSGKHIDLDRGFTIAAWLRTDDIGPGAILSIRNPAIAEAIGINLGRHAHGCVTFGVRDGAGNEAETEGRRINDGQWHHVVAVRDRETSMLRLYLDGVLRGEGSDPTRSLASTTFVSLARNEFGEAGNLSVQIIRVELDDLRLYRHALDANEVTALLSDAEVSSPTPDRCTTG